MPPVEGGAEVSDDPTKPYPKSLGGDFSFDGATAPDGLSWREVEKLIVRPESARLIGYIFGVIGILSLICARRINSAFAENVRRSAFSFGGHPHHGGGFDERRGDRADYPARHLGASIWRAAF